MADARQNIFFRAIEHLMPRGAKAFLFITDTGADDLFDFFRSQWTQFVLGIARSLPADARAFFDGIWGDVWPDTTTQLDLWENQFALVDSGLLDAQRRVRLDATWKAIGGQSPRYLQDILHASGFDGVFIHEFFDPSALPARVVRDPRVYLTDGGPELVVLCGEPEALCGEDGSATSFPILAPVVAGQTSDPLGYPLVNKQRTTTTIFLGAGDPEMECSDRGVTQDPVENFAFAGLGRFHDRRQRGLVAKIPQGNQQQNLPLGRERLELGHQRGRRVAVQQPGSL